MTATATHVTTLYEHEIRVEKLLGSGGFCEVRLAHLEEDDGRNSRDEKKRGEQQIQGTQCYAIKYLSPTIAKRKSKKAFSRGAADLAIEARFLSLLSHDNIIRLHYVSAGSLRENYNCLDTAEDEREGLSCPSGDGASYDQALDSNNTPLRHFGYFLILDHLHETLDQRIKNVYTPTAESVMGEHPSKHHDHHHCCTHATGTSGGGGCQQRTRWLNTLPAWMHHPHAPAFVSKSDGGSHPLKDLLVKRLLILRDIASAVKYLHEHHILFRDIKVRMIRLID